MAAEGDFISGGYALTPTSLTELSADPFLTPLTPLP